MTISKQGNQFSSASGSYATSTHCVSGSGNSCEWISGDQIIVGVYYSSPDTWGGSATWNFDLSGVDSQEVERVEMKISWPYNFYKGLHSTTQTGEGIIRVNNNEISRLQTNYWQCGTDYFATSCFTTSLSYDIPINYVSSSTSVNIETTPKTAWDISSITLYLYTKSGDVKIVDGKLYVKGNLFLVKGVDYAPWIKTTGPNAHVHQPFPGEYEDVTSQVSDNGQIYITDYSGDGKIQGWEVIRYDLETMRSAGINTIRTYAAGEWHDKNLNGVLDRSDVVEEDEISQGDLPYWALDRIVDFSENNNMKVIIGYWVQEEDFEDEDPNTAGYQLECDLEDLEVAKDTTRRVVERYASSPAVIAWGVGNEVHLGQNHDWFTWTVNIVEYLNSLYSYVRSIDSYYKPVMYAKYVGESTNFNNLDADIIAVNAFTHSAQELIDNGEFNIAAPHGKAYMLGEFGHTIGHAEDHWILSQQYAGGCFLEYNDVWWKGSSNLFGIVSQYREQKPERYNELLYLYTGYQECQTDNNCNHLDRDYCDDGVLVKHDEGKCIYRACVAETTTTQDCNDGVGCTVDSCNQQNLSCTNIPNDSLCPSDTICADYYCDAALNCQTHYKPDTTDCGICALCDGSGNCNIYDQTQNNDCAATQCPDSCTLSPDDNPFTWDYADDMPNECTAIFTCSQYQCSYNHECHDNDTNDGIDGISCGATCDQDTDCVTTECNNLDGCYEGTYRDYHDMTNICNENCACTQKECTGYSEIITDGDGDGYDVECDDDCNDNNISVNPGAEEILNGIDDNCDEQIDEGYETIAIQLEKGWNLVSVPIKLENEVLPGPLNSIDGKYSKVFAYIDGKWKSYDPSKTDNSLKTINETIGFWVNMVEGGTLTLQGEESNRNTILIDGWNLVGYPRLTSNLISEYLDTSNISSVMMYDNSQWYSYAPAKPESLNTLEYFVPGRAYWIKST